MIKKVLPLMFTGLFVLTGSLLSASDPKNCICREPTTTETVTTCVVIIGGGGVLGGLALILAAPYAAAAATTAAPYIIPTATAGKVGLGLTAAQLARPLVIQTTEEKLNKLLQQKASRPDKAKREFIDCLKANRHNSPRNASGRPVACEDAALCYALNSSIPALNKKTDAFKNGKCFCD